MFDTGLIGFMPVSQLHVSVTAGSPTKQSAGLAVGLRTCLLVAGTQRGGVRRNLIGGRFVKAYSYARAESTG